MQRIQMLLIMLLTKTRDVKLRKTQICIYAKMERLAPTNQMKNPNLYFDIVKVHLARSKHIALFFSFFELEVYQKPKRVSNKCWLCVKFMANHLNGNFDGIQYKRITINTFGTIKNIFLKKLSQKKYNHNNNDNNNNIYSFFLRTILQ